MRRCAFEGKTVDTSQGNVKRTPATIAAPSAPAGHQHQGIHHGIEMGRSKYTFLYHSARNRKFADSPLEGTGFEFRLTGFGSANFRSLSRWRASNAYQDVVIREPDRTGLSGTWQDPRSDAEAREVVFRVAQPGCGARREHPGDHLRCIGGKGKCRGRGVLFKAAGVARPWNRHDKRLLRQQPGKR